MSLASEFKAFAMRGNVIDLAVGVVIGGAFGRIVSSLVEAVIMPVVGLLTAGADLSTLSVVIGQNAKGDPVLLRYGAVCQAALDFLIQNFLLPRFPDAKIGRPFELGHGIDRLEVRPNEVRVVIKN